MTKEEQHVIGALRSAYAMSGKPNGEMCASITCLNVATVRVFWPVSASEEYPLYCPTCAAWAKSVLEAMGIKYAHEAIPVPKPKDQTRLIDVE